MYVTCAMRMLFDKKWWAIAIKNTVNTGFPQAGNVVTCSL